MTQLPPATEIVQGLVWLGSAKDANDEVFLTRNGIQNVLNTAIEVPENQWTSLKIHAQDTAEYKILEQHSAQATQFLAEAVFLRKPTLIHCAMGMNRSATLLADFLAKILPLPIESVLQWIRSMRPITFSNEAFVRQLLQAHGKQPPQ